MEVKEPIMKLRNKTVRDIGQALWLPKSSVWNIIKTKESTGELSSQKGRGCKTSTIIEDRRILTIINK